MTASQFIRSQPQSTPTRDVLAAGAERGLNFSANLVHAVRSKSSTGRVARGRPTAARSTASSGLNAEIRARIDRFLAEIAELAQQSVIDAVRSQLEPGGALGRRGRPASAPAVRSTKGAKRSPDQIAKTTSALMAAIRQKPGLRIEQLSERLGVSTKEVALPAKKLIADKKLRTTGTRRATRYFLR